MKIKSLSSCDQMSWLGMGWSLGMNVDGQAAGEDLFQIGAILCFSCFGDI